MILFSDQCPESHLSSNHGCPPQGADEGLLWWQPVSQGGPATAAASCAQMSGEAGALYPYG